MAQVDLHSELKNAILRIPRRVVGCQRISQFTTKGFSFFHAMANECSETFQELGDLLDQRFFNDVNGYFDNQPPFQLEQALISGSISEGTLRMNVQEYANSDLDLMCILKNIKVSEADQTTGNLHMREDTPFVDFYVSDEALIQTWADFMETPSSPNHDKHMLSSMKLKLKLEENYRKEGHFYDEHVKEQANQVDDGPAVSVWTTLPKDNGTSLFGIDLAGAEESFDFVLAIKCESWPLCAREWLSRPRCWPTQDVVEKISKEGFHIVCKSSPDGNFRLSFSNAELKLIANLSALQHKVYRAFKSFVNHYKNDWSPNIKKIFCSYHLKTLVLWHCEKTEFMDWNEDTVVSHLLTLIDELITALRERRLPMYFMPKYNLLQDAEDGQSVADKIERLRFDIPKITESIRLEEFNVFGSNFAAFPLFAGIKEKVKALFDKDVINPGDVTNLSQFAENGMREESDQYWKSIFNGPSPRDSKFVSQGRELFESAMSEMFNFQKQVKKKSEEAIQLTSSDSIADRKKGIEILKLKFSEQ